MYGVITLLEVQNRMLQSETSQTAAIRPFPMPP